ncbi:leucine-rich repeat-containing protein 4B-like [Clytia hemisphaerica]|uniref:Ig-like domain-containing protein n=1 Tax=Clytia hemisphaerica TaxID=252671 RepID=A0A7M5UWU3_9CNID
MFGGLPLLHTLLLQENKIQWIEPYAFQGLTALQRLYLFRNEIFYVQERTFFGLFALVELNLGVNKIEGLAKDAFLGLPRLVSLQLNSNFINTIRFGTFAKLRSLYRLVLYFNKVTRVEKGAFDDCKRLGSLLWYPPLTLVKSSRTLKEIPSNDFKCDCQAVWLKQWLTQKTSKVGSIFCNGPATLKGRNVTEVDDEHFTCAPIFMAIEPKLTLLKSGKTAQIRCNVNALAEYTWIKNGSVLTNQFKTFQTNTGALFVHNVTEADSGEYICLVKTENATLAGSSIVKVGVQPSIIGNKEEIVDVQKENENVVLICPNEGFPKPLVFWHYAGKLIQDGSEDRFIGFDGRLILTKMTAKNAGVYVCTANNEFGMDKKTFYLRVSAEKESYCEPTCATGYECKMKYTCQCSKERALNDGMCSSTVEGRSFGSGDGPENNEIGDNEANDVDDDFDNDEFSRKSFTDVSHSIMTTTSSTTPKRGGPVV